MATITTIKMTDDLDGTTSDDVATIRFALDGTTYEIDLSEGNRQALVVALKPYIDAARTPTTTTKQRKKTNGSGPDPAQVRAWAAANGITVATRGRIPASVIDQYTAAQR